jgi:PKD repeat protein
MSGTHTSSGLPQAAEGRAVKKLMSVLPLVVLALLMAIAPSQLFAGEDHSGWTAAKYEASGSEKLTAVDFVTSASDLSFAIQVYSDLEGGVPSGLLARQEGRTHDPGFYSVRFDTPARFTEGQSFVVVLALKGQNKGGAFLGSAPGVEAESAYTTERPQAVFESRDGLRYSLYSGPASFSVRMASAVSPEATAISTFTVSAGPVAGSPVTFTFSATGTTAGDAMDWVLKYGDGSTDGGGSGASPLEATDTHTYQKAGTYTATLYVIDTVDGTQAQKTLQVVVAIPVDATADRTCGLAALNVCFTGDVDPATCTPPLTWLWVFGDGGQSTEQNPCHPFTKKGSYTAILTVRDAAGASGTGPAITIDVTLPMVVTATADTLDGIDPTVVNFCATVSEGLPPYTYEWDFGDESEPAIDPCPTHAFNGVGTYTVTVTVKDSCEQEVTSNELTVTVHQSPWIRITAPASGSKQQAIVNIQTAIMVEEGVTITRVEFYVDGYLIGLTTAPPWAWSFDASGLHGSYTLTAKAYDSRGRSTTSDPVTINLDNPWLDGRVDSSHNPFRLKIYGNWFDRGAQVRINGVPVPQTVRKGATMIVAKGGETLKALVPEGVPVVVTVHNPDGGISQGSTFTRIH